MFRVELTFSDGGTYRITRHTLTAIFRCIRDAQEKTTGFSGCRVFAVVDGAEKLVFDGGNP